jgi:hypothetical protein
MQPAKAMRGELLRNIPDGLLLSVLMRTLRNSGSRRTYSLRDQHDKPENVPTNYQGNWLGQVDLITGLAVRGERAKKLRSRVHGSNLNPNSILFEQRRESSPNTYLTR